MISNIKKQIIRNSIKLEVVSNTEGKMEIYISQIKKIEDEYKSYEKYVQNAMMLLKGVNKIEVIYDSGLLKIYYDHNMLNSMQVDNWVKTIVNVGIEYYDEIKRAWNKDGNESEEVSKVWQKMKPILMSKLK